MGPDNWVTAYWKLEQKINLKKKVNLGFQNKKNDILHKSGTKIKINENKKNINTSGISKWKFHILY